MSKNILVIDNDQIEALVENFKALGYEVSIANLDSYKKLPLNQFTVIILSDVCELAYIVDNKFADKNFSQQVIVYTTSQDVEDIRTGLNIGAFFYAVKGNIEDEELIFKAVQFLFRKSFDPWTEYNWRVPHL